MTAKLFREIRCIERNVKCLPSKFLEDICYTKRISCTRRCISVRETAPLELRLSIRG